MSVIIGADPIEKSGRVKVKAGTPAEAPKTTPEGAEPSQAVKSTPKRKTGGRRAKKADSAGE